MLDLMLLYFLLLIVTLNILCKYRDKRKKGELLLQALDYRAKYDLYLNRVLKTASIFSEAYT